MRVAVLTFVRIDVSIAMMTNRRVTANLPDDLLEAARRITGKGITDTIIEGLEQVKRRRFYERALALQGRVPLKVDLESLRGRRRR